MHLAMVLLFDATQRREVERLVRAGASPQKIALPARIVLRAAAGIANEGIARELGTSRPTVLLWRRPFAAAGLRGPLRDRPRSGRTPTLTAKRIARVVDATLRTTPAGPTHWSVRTMAKAHGLGRTTVHRVWRQYGLQPHRVETFKLSLDPRFVWTKGADLILGKVPDCKAAPGTRVPLAHARSGDDAVSYAPSRRLGLIPRRVVHTRRPVRGGALALAPVPVLDRCRVNPMGQWCG